MGRRTIACLLAVFAGVGFALEPAEDERTTATVPGGEIHDSTGPGGAAEARAFAVAPWQRQP